MSIPGKKKVFRVDWGLPWPWIRFGTSRGQPIIPLPVTHQAFESQGFK
jgi:hypothetical protein